MSERHGYLVEFPRTKRKRVFWGAGRADMKAFNYGRAMGKKLGVETFSLTDTISARTVEYVVNVATFEDHWKTRNRT